MRPSGRTGGRKSSGRPRQPIQPRPDRFAPVSDYWTAATARPCIKKPFRGQRPDLHDFLEEVARRVRHTEPAKFAKAGNTVGIWARETFPNHAKLKFGYYPAKPATSKKAR
jgi:hypothetical protein